MRFKMTPWLLIAALFIGLYVNCANDEVTSVNILFDLNLVGSPSQPALIAVIKESTAAGKIDVLTHTDIAPIFELEISTSIMNDPQTDVILVLATFDEEVSGVTPIFVGVGDIVPANHVQALPLAIYQSILAPGATLRALESGDEHQELVSRFAHMIYIPSTPDIPIPEATVTPTPEPTVIPTSTPTPRPGDDDPPDIMDPLKPTPSSGEGTTAPIKSQ